VLRLSGVEPARARNFQGTSSEAAGTGLYKRTVLLSELCEKLGGTIGRIFGQSEIFIAY